MAYTSILWASMTSVAGEKGDSPFDDDNDDDDDTKIFSTPENFRKTRSGRRDRFRQKIVKIGAILAIYKPFEIRKWRALFFGEFDRSSQDLRESHYDSPKSWDDRPNSPKFGKCIFVIGTKKMSCSQHK